MITMPVRPIKSKSKQVKKSPVLTPEFVANMKKPTERRMMNYNSMTLTELKAEYTRQSKVANKRIAAIGKADLYSYAYAMQQDKGIVRFGLKNQNLTTKGEIVDAYKNLITFLNSTTSSKTGIKTTIDKMVTNFHLNFDGNYKTFSLKAKKIFGLWDDYRVMKEHGYITDSTKYEVIEDLGTLFDSGLINENTTIQELENWLTELKKKREQGIRAQYRKLNFEWEI